MSLPKVLCALVMQMDLGCSFALGTQHAGAACYAVQDFVLHTYDEQIHLVCHAFGRHHAQELVCQHLLRIISSGLCGTLSGSVLSAGNYAAVAPARLIEPR